MYSDEERPEISSLILLPTRKSHMPVLKAEQINAPSTRRSPRKTASNTVLPDQVENSRSSIIMPTRQKSSSVKVKSHQRSKSSINEMLPTSQPLSQHSRIRLNKLEHTPVVLPNANLRNNRTLNIPPSFSDVQILDEDSKSSGYTQSSMQLKPLKLKNDGLDMLTASFSNVSIDHDENDSSKENMSPGKKGSPSKSGNTRSTQPTSQMSRITRAARQTSPAKSQSRVESSKNGKEFSNLNVRSDLGSTRSTLSASPRKQTTKPKRTAKLASSASVRRFISHEAFCEDLDESSGSDGEGEGEDTDLSGFIVDDDANISIHISSDSENDVREDYGTLRRPRQRKEKAEKAKIDLSDEEVSTRPRRRRLQRGRRRALSDSDTEAESQSNEKKEMDDSLSNALEKMSLGKETLETHQNAERRRTIEVVDLTSSPVQEATKLAFGMLPPLKVATKNKKQATAKTLDIFENFDDALKLNPTSNTERIERPKTPPTTPPRTQSPPKLKSPSKLLFSPSKRGDTKQRSPHRQSMDAFWDHQVVNEWNDQFSPKKTLAASPKKNLLLRFMESASWSDSEDELSGSYNESNESTDSLPSPCESPSKSRVGASPSKNERAQAKRIADENRTRKAQKKLFDQQKEQMALDLLAALDKHITDSKISLMSASTGGVQIIWSKTLRSTAGRANWRRTVTKPTGSPVKGTDPVSGPGVKVEHFASIELATKVIDRPDRLINTLAHEFCHLANFMVSGVRDQPHGESFKRWGAKTTNWMRSQSENPEWQTVEVTTKHGYVIEHKYMWMCAGRQSLSMKMLNIEDEGGCGAEYGRHSKSIDVEKHRCGRCKGQLVQVRPTPRANSNSPVKKSPVKRLDLRKAEGVEVLEKMVEMVELSD